MEADDPFVTLPSVETRKVQVKGRTLETPPTPVIESILSTFGTVRTKRRLYLYRRTYRLHYNALSSALATFLTPNHLPSLTDFIISATLFQYMSAQKSRWNDLESMVRSPLDSRSIGQLQTKHTFTDLETFCLAHLKRATCTLMNAVLEIAKKTLPLLFEFGFIDILIELLKSLETIRCEEEYEREQLQHRIISDVHSIAQSSSENRDALNNKEIHLSLCSIVETSADDTLVAACIDTLSVLISDESPPEMWKLVAASVNEGLQLDYQASLISAFNFIKNLSREYSIKIATPNVVSSLVGLILTETEYGYPMTALQVVGELICSSADVRHLLVDAGIIPNLLALPKVHHDQVAAILFDIVEANHPPDIDTFMDANAHIFLFNFINETEDALACLALRLGLQNFDSDNFHRLVSAPLFLVALQRCLVLFSSQTMPAVGRLLDYGQRLGQLQTGLFDLELPCGTAPNNPFLDYLYAKCRQLLNDAGEPRSADYAHIAKILKFVGNGHRPN